MKILSTFLLIVLLFLCLGTQPGAETTAYIPSLEGATDGNVTKVLTAGETFSGVELSGEPYGAAVTPQGDYVLITRSGDDSVTIIPSGSFSSPSFHVSKAVGDEPRGVAVEPEGKYAYVANYNDNTVSKIDIDSAEVVDPPIDVGNGPLGVAAAYDQEHDTPLVYVTNHLDDRLWVIGDDDHAEEYDIACNEPSGVVVTPNGAALYVACTGDDTVKVVRTSDISVLKTITVESQPWGVAIGSDGEYVFVTNSADDTVSVIDTSSNTVVDTIDVGQNPMGIAAPRNGDFAYAVNQVGNSIHRIDISSGPSFSATELGNNRINTAVSIGAFIGGPPPSPVPSGLEAETISDNEIELTWNDNSSDELGFKIERRKDEEEAFVQVAKVDDDTESYTDDELEGGTTYHYRIRAYNEAADSDASSSVEATTTDEDFSWCFVGTIYVYD